MPQAPRPSVRFCASFEYSSTRPEFQAQLPVNTAAQPLIFVTGASRSGTTLVGQTLGRHSAIASLREMQYFGESWSRQGKRREMGKLEARRAVTSLVERQDHGVATSHAMHETVDHVMISLDSDTDNTEVFAATVNHFAQRMGKSIACEQTPRNIYYAEALLNHFRAARFIHVQRDPRAVTASQKLRWRKRSLMSDPSRMSRLRQIRAWFNYHPYSVARLWNQATAEAVRLQHHPRFHTVLFEDLLAEPERTIRKLCAFLGLPYEDSMLVVEHVNSSYAASTGRQSGFSQTPIESWRSALTSAEKAVISERCDELMTQVGYAPTDLHILRRADISLGVRYGLHVVGALALNPRRLQIQAHAALTHYLRERELRIHGSRRAPLASVKRGPLLESTSKRVFGLPCTDTSLEAAAEHLATCAQTGTTRHVAFVNAHCLNQSVGDPLLLRALQRADILFADGIGMHLASRLHGHRLDYNVNGTDLFPFLCNCAESAGIVIGLLGGAPGVARRCAEVIRQRNPNLQIAYVHNGLIEPGTDDQVIAAINASGAELLMVAMGVPLQERWVLDHGESLNAPVVISVGGLLDFVSGDVQRAPPFMRKLGMEWMFRLYVEPHRLFRRYVLGNPIFLARALRFAVTGRLWAQDKRVDYREAT